MTWDTDLRVEAPDSVVAMAPVTAAERGLLGRVSEAAAAAAAGAAETEVARAGGVSFSG